MGAALKLENFFDHPVLDEKKLQSIKDLGDGDDDFFQELTDLFFERVPILLGEIEEALKNKDAHKFERSSHALKGTSGNLGAMRMMKICEHLETMGRNGTIDGLEGLFQDLRNIYPDVQDTLKSKWLK